MAVSREAIETILNFYPEPRNDGSIETLHDIDLGEVEEGKRLIYGPRSYQRRAEAIPGEPLIFGETRRQPVLYIKEGLRVATLAYRADVEALGNLGTAVSNHIRGILEARGIVKEVA